MKRRLTARELVLLGILAAVLLVSGYVMLFYLPVTAELDRLANETELCRAQLTAAQQRAEEKQRMERELEELFAQPEPPQGMPAYDNVQQVMFELNAILASAEEYALSFGTVDAGESIVHRRISLSFTSGSYEQAKAVLQQLHGSVYRCMLDDLRLSLDSGQQDSVTVSGSIVFFEYVPLAGQG